MLPFGYAGVVAQDWWHRSGGTAPRVIQLKVCAHFDALCQFTHAWMLPVQTELEAEWAPQPGWPLWGRNTGSSKKMDGIWNRYNLQSTRRSGRPVDFCFSTVPVSLNWFIHRFKALSVGGFSPGCKLRHLRCTATTHFSSAYRNTNWAFWWTVHILPRTD